MTAENIFYHKRRQITLKKHKIEKLKHFNATKRAKASEFCRQSNDSLEMTFTIKVASSAVHEHGFDSIEAMRTFAKQRHIFKNKPRKTWTKKSSCIIFLLSIKNVFL